MPDRSSSEQGCSADLAAGVPYAYAAVTTDRPRLLVFTAHEPPATLLGVSVLGYPDQLFEVEAVAALPG